MGKQGVMLRFSSTCRDRLLVGYSCFSAILRQLSFIFNITDLFVNVRKDHLRQVVSLIFLCHDSRAVQ